MDFMNFMVESAAAARMAQVCQPATETRMAWPARVVYNEWYCSCNQLREEKTV
jgi:hypothetical protein